MMTNLLRSAFAANKLFSTIARLRLLLVMFLTLTVSSEVWADTHTIGWGSASGTTGTYTNFSATTGTVTNIVSFSTASNSSQTTPAYNSNSSELRLYYASNGSGGSITLTPATGITITGFVMTTSTAPTVKYKVGSGNLTTVSKASNANTYTVSNITVTSSNALTIQNANTSNTQLRIKTIQITFTKSGGSTSVSSVALDPSSLSLEIGETSTLTATVLPNNATNKSITWSSSDSNVATVIDGIVTARAEGTTTITATSEADNTKKATCLVTVTAPAGGGGSECTWQLVTDASTLKVDDEIIIAASNNNYAISTNQANNNRTATAIIKGNDILTNPSSDVQILTLQKGTVEGTWAFYTGSGYLYAASSSGNQLKTQTTNNANGSWTISISNKIASIKANGTNTRNVMQFNPNNGSPIFACYSSASMQAIALYKKVCTGGSTETSLCLTPKYGGDSGGTWRVITEWYRKRQATCGGKQK